MNTPILKTLTRILTLCALSVGFAAKRRGIRASVYLLAYFTALNVFAQQSLFVNGTAYIEPGAATYSATSTARAALQVQGTSAAGSNGSYTGSNITLSSTFDSNDGRFGAYINNQGSLALYNSTITTSGTNGTGVRLYVGGSARLENTRITTTGSLAFGVYASEQSAATVTDSAISTSGDAADGISAVYSNTLTVTGGTITTTGSAARGIYLSQTSAATADSVLITTTGSNATGFVATNQSTATINDSTISTIGDNARGLGAFYSSTLTVNGGTINTTGNFAIGIYATEQSTVTATNNTISTNGDYSYGLGALYSSTLTVNGGTVITTGSGASGVYASSSSRLSAIGVDITTRGYWAVGLYGNQAAEVIGEDLHITTYGDRAVGIGSNGISSDDETVPVAVMTINRATIETHGADAYGLLVGGAHGNLMTVTDVDVHTTGVGSAGANIDFGGPACDKVAVLTRVNLNAEQGAGLQINNVFGDYSVEQLLERSGSYNVTLNDSTVSGTAAINIDCYRSGTTADGVQEWVLMPMSSAIIANSSTFTGDLIQTGSALHSEVNFNANSTLTGDIITDSHAVLAVTLNDSTVTGDTITQDDSALALSGSNGATIIGNLTANADSTINLTLTGSDTTLTGDLTGNSNSTLTVTVNDNSTLTGDLIGSGSSTLDITVSDGGTLAGNITTSEDNNTTVTISDGGAIIGDLTGSDNSTLAVTVGEGGTLTGALNGDQVTVTVNTGGNVTINQDSDFNSLANSGNVTVDTGSVIITNPITGNGTTTINDSGNLTASFDGGNGSLVINPGGSVNLTQDSNLGTISNDGTLNIGDYQVSVSDLANNGTIDIAVNTDSGAHGTLHVTGTSSGAGTIHVTSTGDGQANPNDILGNLVTGNGTANYTWDEVDWGLEELIVTPNPDGTISIKEDGTSPAGAVLNSAIAVQQSLWFAQQNSLLKRMGELRYGARVSRPLADKDVRVPYNSLIENIWLRSYGQQLNVGSQVSGKAYEQLIYGVDLGTDHKFTISADSDLYLGVYAGYGRSDIDYRTPGTDGELNSYYGGLYATWLHSSGFYIDATFKAVSVNNDLKAPYGNTQLTASYSDVNIGGSIELGNKFTFTDDWFIEPQLQVNYLHILAENYSAGPMTISAQDLDALQLRIGSLFGRSIKLANGGALQPYVKISGVETISSGGTIRNGYQSTRANTDGARAEVGGGIIWQLDADNQLHLDYEASFGDKYDKPWGLTAGYRHQF